MGVTNFQKTVRFFWPTLYLQTNKSTEVTEHCKTQTYWTDSQSQYYMVLVVRSLVVLWLIRPPQVSTGCRHQGAPLMREDLETDLTASEAATIDQYTTLQNIQYIYTSE